MKTQTNQTTLRTQKDAAQFWEYFLSQEKSIVEMLIAADLHDSTDFKSGTKAIDGAADNSVSKSMTQRRDDKIAVTTMNALKSYMHDYCNEIEFFLRRDKASGRMEVQLLVFGDGVAKANANSLKDSAPTLHLWDIKVLAQSRTEVVPNAMVCISEIHFEILPDAGNKLLAGRHLAGKPSLMLYVNDVNWLANDAAKKLVMILLDDCDMVNRFSAINLSFDTSETYERGQSIELLFEALDAYFGGPAETHH